MGVPALFRWLSTKYPKIVTPVNEEKPKNINGIHIPVDLTQPNPNGMEFDNLYLDLNGIVHPCTHPEDKPAPPTEEAMMVEIFNYLDRIMSMIRPRKLLYIAIDGVAPRAKMNQQRSRRFKAGLEARLKKEALMKEKLSMEEAKQAYEEIKANGVKEAFDSNCITPGTPFMDLLSASLKYYLVEKLNSDQGWQQLNVILSDASVPGEGEHKIMDYIRRMRLNPDYDPNTEHVMYGLDADLIMLSLATHEPRFKLLREDVSFGKSKGGCTKCGRMGHSAANCRARGTVSVQRTDPDSAANPGDHPQKPFVLLHVNILREYLAVQLQNPNQNFPFDLENALDDWVFLIFFVGNDFLPHLPSLEIREGAIDRLIEMWKRTLATVDGYLTHNGEINMPRVKLILDELAGLEDEIFRMRGEREESFRQRKANQEANQIELKGKPENENRDAAAKLRAQLLARKTGTTPPEVEPVVPAKRSEPEQDLEENNTELTQAENSASVNPAESETNESKPEEEKEKENGEAQTEQEEKDNADTIKLHEPGYKQRYYESKFGVPVDDIEFRKSLAASYMEGLIWVMRYYFQGCASWKWFYPYHYPPFASDLALLDQNFTANFNRGIPLRPYEQLMGVLPADSKKHLPDPFHFLMENAESPIIDFYPKDFEQDMNGKKFAWQATVILPFIDESRLLDACNSVYSQLTEDETRRNSVGKELLFLGSNNPLCPQIVELYTVNASDESANTIDTKPSKGVSGTIARDVNFVPHSTYPSPLISVNKPDIHNERAFCALYKMVQPPESFVYPATLLPGVQLPRRVLNNFDIANTENNASRSKRNGNDYSRHEYFPGRDNNAGYGPQRDDHYVNHDLEPQVYKAPRNNHSQSDRGGYRGGYRGQNNNQYNNYGQHHGHQQGYHNNSGQRYQNNQYGHGNQNAGYGSHNNQGRGNYHHGGNNNAGYQSNQYQGGQHGYHPGPYASQSHHQGGSYNNRGGYSHNNSRGRGGRGNYRGNY